MSTANGRLPRVLDLLDPDLLAAVAAGRSTPTGLTSESALQDWARDEVHERSGGRCELGCGREATDWSHRVGAGQLGLWTPWNGLHLCRKCHGWLHGHPEAAVAGGWALTSGQDPARELVLLPGPWLAWWLLGPGWDGGPHVVADARSLDAGVMGRPVVAGGLGLFHGLSGASRAEAGSDSSGGLTLPEMQVTLALMQVLVTNPGCEADAVTATDAAWLRLLAIPRAPLYGRDMVAAARTRHAIRQAEEALIGAASAEDVELCEFQCLSPVDVEYLTTCARRVCAACREDHDRECAECAARIAETA